jgi:hypothetical protein
MCFEKFLIVDLAHRRTFEGSSSEFIFGMEGSDIDELSGANWIYHNILKWSLR